MFRTVKNGDHFYCVDSLSDSQGEVLSDKGFRSMPMRIRCSGGPIWTRRIFTKRDHQVSCGITSLILQSKTKFSKSEIIRLFDRTRSLFLRATLDLSLIPSCSADRNLIM